MKNITDKKQSRQIDKSLISKMWLFDEATFKHILEDLYVFENEITKDQNELLTQFIDYTFNHAFKFTLTENEHFTIKDFLETCFSRLMK